MCQPVFEYMKRKFMFNHETVVGDSIIVGEDNIVKALNVIYDNDILPVLRETIIDNIKNRFNLTNDDFTAIQEEFANLDRLH